MPEVLVKISGAGQGESFQRGSMDVMDQQFSFCKETNPAPEREILGAVNMSREEIQGISC